ncbi:MAG: hypothetical protein CVU56_14600 [Deltaproteobacteria bacterium HGW-Deltaproteobacteria-14]|nr:MAG: hypothetical protein CVU56_14600 [Deltaproteobacteria bacterium HGW-Deltaproteobacteria-14]
MNPTLSRRLWTTLAAVAALLAGCADGTPRSPEPRTGSQIAIEVAPLHLEGVTDAVYAIRVTNAPDGGGEVVWERTSLTSSQFGDGAGALSYVGPCDADAGVNSVTLTLLTLYEGDGSVVSEDAYDNPGALTRDVECLEDGDVSVVFDLTIVRDARQGFFDVAVDFDNIFCSAKLDCERDDGSNIDLLINPAANGRDMTAVLGLACVGDPTALDTYLYMNDIRIVCDGPDYAPVIIDPTGKGNIDTNGPGSSNADGYLFGAAVFRGAEQLAGQAYWNIALGLNELEFQDAGDCVLSARATASAEEWAQTTSGFPLPEGTVYPVIEWNVPLTNSGGRVCTRHAVNAPGSGVETVYDGYLPLVNAMTWSPGVVYMDARYDTQNDQVLRAAAAVCSPSCVHGSCEAPGVCDCAGTGFEGETCADDIDECATGADDCGANALCTDVDGGFTCTCAPDYEGDPVAGCTDIDECATGADDCGANSVCTNTGGGFTCACAAGYAGDPVDGCADVDECATHTSDCGLNAFCTNAAGSFTCSCADGYEGDPVAGCTEIDECSPNPCLNGGACTDGVAAFICDCPVDYAGDACEVVVNDCDPNPCVNGGTCTDGVGTFTCACPAGFSGDTCATNVDDCAGNPCLNGGVCSDGVASFTCACADGFVGATCAANVDDCAGSPCLNGGVCSDGVASFTCACANGFTGDTCETNIDDCAGAPCLNGGTCVDGVASYTCTCPAGFDGATCETNIDDCEGLPCDNGGTCSDGIASFTCACPTGFEGATCETNIDDCAGAPCLNGGTCSDGVASFTCACPAGFDGPTCATNSDDCAGNPCLNGGTCSDGVASFTCACPAGFSGATCATNSDDCAGAPCLNGGVCTDGVASFTCACANGFTGDTCATNSDDCSPDPCLNGGTCSDGVAAFTCACAAGFSGATCATDIDDCQPDPCLNGGACSDGVDTFTCACPLGFDGPTCATNLDDCTPNPCLNGGTCVDGVASYVCGCATGWSGTTCADNIDDCATTPCLNGGTCIDGVGTASCDCPAGFSGSTCSVNIDDCGPNPCLNGGTCSDGVDAFTCACAPGFTGDTCATDVDECAGAPCLNGGVCTDGVNAFTCACATGWEGDTCEIDVDDCATPVGGPCLNGGACTDHLAGFTCACAPGFDGPTCSVDVDECATDHGGCDPLVTCTDNPGPPVTCGACPDGTAPTVRDDFADGDAQGWSVTDNGTYPSVGAASSWNVAAQAYFQDEQIGGPPGFGTCASIGSTRWSDVTVSASVQPGDLGGVGLIVRRASADTYYVFVAQGDSPAPASFLAIDPDVGGGEAHFIRVEGGAATILWSAPFARPGSLFTMAVTAEGDTFTLRAEDSVLAVVTDAAIPSGAVGLFTSFCAETFFDDVAAIPATDGLLCVSCPPGYAGVDCASEIDECAPAPCLNGGVCTDGLAGFTCACPTGYAGATCEIDVDECATGHGGCDPAVTCADRPGPPAACGDCPDDTTRVFRDAFDDGDFDGWTVTNMVDGYDGVWAVQDGQLVQLQNIQDTIATTGSPYWSDVTVSATLMSTDNDSLGLVVRHRSANTFYVFGLKATSGFSLKYVDGVKTGIQSYAATYTTGVPFRYEVQAVASTFTVSIDGTVVATIEDDAIPFGAAGVYSRVNKVSHYDDFVVTPANTDGVLCSPCPAGLLGPECTVDSDECLAAPCANGGACTNTFGGFTCACPDGWGGATCTAPICGGAVCDDGDLCTTEFCDGADTCAAAPKCDDQCEPTSGFCYSCDGLTEGFESDAWLAGQGPDAPWAQLLPGSVAFDGYTFTAQGDTWLAAAARSTGDAAAYRSLRVDQAAGGAVVIGLPQLAGRVALTVWSDDPGDPAAPATFSLSGGGSGASFTPTTTAQVVTLDLATPGDTLTLALDGGFDGPRTVHVDAIAYEPELCAGACAAGACVNGGACDTGAVPATCACPAGWTGPTCADDVDECLDVDCPVLQQCTNLPGGYACACPAGVSGPACDVGSCPAAPCDADGDPCTTQACQDGACVVGPACAEACDAATGACATCGNLYLDFEDDAWLAVAVPTDPEGDAVEIASPTIFAGHELVASPDGALFAMAHASGDPARYRGVSFLFTGANPQPATIVLPQIAQRVGLTLPAVGDAADFNGTYRLSGGGAHVDFQQDDNAPREITLDLATPTDTLTLTRTTSGDANFLFDTLIIDGVGHEPAVCPADQCGADTCLNGGTCTDEVGYGRCDCPAGFVGPDCGSVDAVCGDGAVGLGEACDDGNTDSGDGCRGDCLGLEVCGDGLLDEGEACEPPATARPTGSAGKTAYLGNHVYQWFPKSDDPETFWSTAKAACESMGGHLVTITSAEEQAAVESLQPNKPYKRWIGLTWEANTPRWITGEPVVYSQLLTIIGPFGQMSAPAQDGRWDLTSNTTNDYICEFEAGACSQACEPTCGDGIREGAEACDDGFRNGTWDHCLADCSSEQRCGNGVIEPGETCDDGGYNGLLGACNALCGRAVCGDGVVQAGEACDDGPMVGRGLCLNDCSGLQSCGDGARQGTEACDDGALNGTFDHCVADCSVVQTCGDGALQPGETCDDGANTGVLGGCWPDCRPVVACAGVLDTAPCDDGDPCTSDLCTTSGICVNEAACEDGCVADVGTCYACDALVESFETDAWLAGQDAGSDYAQVLTPPASYAGYAFNASGGALIAASARSTGDAASYRGLMADLQTGGALTVELPAPALRVALTLWSDDAAAVSAATDYVLSGGASSQAFDLPVGVATQVVLELAEPAQTITLALGGSVDGDKRVYVDAVAYETALCPEDQCAGLCQNGASCDDGLGTATCQCASGWTGPTCAVEIDECASNPCANGGTCTDLVAGFVCACPDFYDGATCETRICTPALCDDGDPCTVDACDAALSCVHGPKCDDSCVPDTGECLACSQRVVDFEDPTWPTEAGADWTSETSAPLESPVTFDGHTFTAPTGGGLLSADTVASGDPARYRALELFFSGVGTTATIQLPQPADRVTLSLPAVGADGVMWGAQFRLEAGGSAAQFVQDATEQDIALDLVTPDDLVTLTVLNDVSGFGLATLTVDAIAHERSACGTCGDGVLEPIEVCEGPVDAAWPDMANTATSGGHLLRRYDAALTWAEARADCEAQGGYLATIHSAAENDAATSLGVSGGVYFGLTIADGTQAWVTDEPYAFESTTSTQSWGGPYGRLGTNGTWAGDSDGTAVKPYLCEFEVGACTATCEGVCGDGIIASDEGCDDGTLNGNGAGRCRADCSAVEACGDGIVDAGEVCDDGNTDSGDGCRADCLGVEICGDGLVDDAEPCDDGNDVDTDDCKAGCVPNVCGDGIANTGGQTPEACDDGNTESGDGCRADCQGVEVCGDGLRDGGELCDGPADLPWGDMSNTATWGGHLYKRFTANKNWTDARDDCAARGGALATVHSAEEDAAVQSLSHPSRFTWFGLSELGGDRTWVTGEPMTYAPTITYAASVYLKECGALRPRVIGGWVIDTCGSGSNYICEFAVGVCTAQCTGVCGDGVVTSDEVCDDGAQSDTWNHCFGDCGGGQWCGDGIVQTGEVCDGGGTLGEGLCNPTCSGTQTCGDGAAEGDEACDDGNTEDGDGCRGDCLSDESCGNGTLDAGEACDDGNTEDADGCSGDCLIVTTCGNGVIDAGEVCDDGVLNGTDGHCTPGCDGVQVCGDLVVEGSEACDDGILAGEGYCASDCSSVQDCGDGVVQGSEACDDGVNNGLFGFCASDCSALQTCGDGIVQPGEVCDAGAANGTPGTCWTDCSVTFVCGDGYVVGDEACDDGNLLDGDGCRADCAGFEACGDGLVDVGEVCDDGDDNGSDGMCTPQCDGVQVCGDTVVEGSEVCDDGAPAGEGTCANDCSGLQICQDGVVRGTETCDDGNDVAGDGCRADCTTEVCGDGILDTEAGELCDDGAGNGLPLACTHDCDLVVECGDGAVEWPEACDDGALNGTADHCASDCAGRPSCGDGVVQGSEACDPGAAALAVCEGGLRFVSEGSLFCLKTAALSFTSARADCQAEGGDLAIITQVQNDALKVPIASAADAAEFFIGLKRVNTASNTFKWLSGTNAGYADWAPGFPHIVTYWYGDATNPTDRLFVTLGADGRRDRAAAEGGFAYVCEYPWAPCGAQCAAGGCGDGVIGDGERCDDGAAGLCNAACDGVVACGDGVVDWSEACDEGDDNALVTGGCNGTCDGYSYCGDGVLQTDEVCDDGADNGTVAGKCDSACTHVIACGDGLVELDEVCDDGANNGLAGYCNDACSGYEGCGDGVVQGNETCDEGADNGAYGCTSGIAALLGGVHYCAGPTGAACGESAGKGGTWAKVNAGQSASVAAAFRALGQSGSIGLQLTRIVGCPSNTFEWPDGTWVTSSDPAWAAGEPSQESGGGPFGGECSDSNQNVTELALADGKWSSTYTWSSLRRLCRVDRGCDTTCRGVE